MSKNASHSRRVALKLGTVSSLALLLTGCKATPPGGTTVQPNPLGSVVDEANRRQEDNAEAAKFIVYNHEFELNKPLESSEQEWIKSADGDDTDMLRTVRSIHPRGFRLNEYGAEHVERLAKVILSGSQHEVVVERSESSKRQKTRYHHPVHLNDRLDDERREVVVAALVALGVENAEDLVVVAPAFPTGLHSQEAAQAYNQSRFNGGQGSGGGRSGGAGGSAMGGI